MVKIFFLRHARSEPIVNRSPDQWKLSIEGFTQAEQLKKRLPEHVTQPDAIICSEEIKTFETVYPYAKSNGIPILKWSEFNEANSHLPFEIDKNQYLARKQGFFRKLKPETQEEFSLFNKNFVEHPLIALQRFRKGIQQVHHLDNANQVLICTHGTVLSLFWAWLTINLEKPDEIFNFWKNMPFCGLYLWEEGSMDLEFIPIDFD